MTKVQITAADVTDEDMMLFSDFYKECYNVRPRFTPTKQDYANLANNYDQMQADNQAEEDRYLQSMRDEHGVNFANIMEYYSWLENKWAQESVAREQSRIEADELKKPGIKAVIDQWDHGEIG